MSGLCMALNTCMVNTFYYKDSNVHFTLKSNIYIIYVNITDEYGLLQKNLPLFNYFWLDDDNCPQQFCEGHKAEFCHEDGIRCSYQSVCVCTYWFKKRCYDFILYLLVSFNDFILFGLFFTVFNLWSFCPLLSNTIGWIHNWYVCCTY